MGQRCSSDGQFLSWEVCHSDKAQICGVAEIPKFCSYILLHFSCVEINDITVVLCGTISVINVWENLVTNDE